MVLPPVALLPFWASYAAEASRESSSLAQAQAQVRAPWVLLAEMQEQATAAYTPQTAHTAARPAAAAREGTAVAGPGWVDQDVR